MKRNEKIGKSYEQPCLKPFAVAQERGFSASAAVGADAGQLTSDSWALFDE